MTAPTTPREVLLAAAALIEQPGAWTTGHLARDADGEETEPAAADAVCWCMEGALRRVCGGKLDLRGVDLGGQAWTLLRRSLESNAPHVVNDAPGRTQAECVAMLRKAAEVAP